MDGTILRETLQAILPESIIEQYAEKLGVVERSRKRDIVKLVYSLVLSAGSDDSGVLADAMKRYNTEARERVVRGAFYAWLDDEMADMQLSTEGFSWIMQKIVELGKRYSKGRIISILEGGYSLKRLPELAKNHVEILLNA